MVQSRRVYGPAAETKPEARRLLKLKLELEGTRRELDPPFARYWYDSMPRLKKRLSPSTYALYETVYEAHVRTAPIATIRLSSLRTRHIEEWADSIPGKPRTVARYLQCAKSLLQHALESRLIDHNPASPVRPPRIDEHEKRILSREEVSRLLALPWTPRERLAVLLMLHGLRRSEACGLMSKDFDGDGITVRRQALEVNGVLLVRNATKTGESRWVPVDDELKGLLKDAQGYVLGTTAGTPLRPRNLHRSFKRVTQGTEFSDQTPHDLRSAFAMRLLESGADVRTAAEILGHSPAMLAKVYARSGKELKMEALKRAVG